MKGSADLDTVRVAFVSLGCAKNLVNTEQMMSLCRDAGMEITGDPEDADVAVLNTCSFIDAAKSEAIEQILELAEIKKEGKLKKLIVTGCLPQRYPEELRKEMPEVDGVLGTGSYPQIVSAVHAVLRGETPVLFGDIDDTEEGLPRLLATPWYTAYLKIAEGCDNRCAYCVIPSLRGRYRSRSMESLVEEARLLSGSGVKELIIIAQDITRYGTDLNGRRCLPELLDRLCELPFHWIRLHYLYPDEVDDALLDCVERHPQILHYFDIPIQHISDRILRSMNRRGTGVEIRNLFAGIRRRMPDAVIRTSLITGLPGETEKDFDALCAFLREEKLQRAGVFCYSREEGTPAAVMADQVPEEVAEKRAEILRDIEENVLDEYNDSRLGTEVEVLCEGFDEEYGAYIGRTYADSPDIDGHVWFTAPPGIREGDFIPVRLTGLEDGNLTGEIADGTPDNR